MIANLQPYPEYKELGLPWLGGIPRHWDTGPGFAAFREKQVKNTGMREKAVLSLSYGRIVAKPPEKLHGLVPESFETYQIVDPGDIIIRSTDLQNDWNSLRVGLVRNRGIITSAYLCFRTTGALSPEYGYQLLHTFDLMKVFYGMGSGLRQNLDFRDFKRMLIFVPPPEEQATIVRFLNYANGRLERASRAKRKVIALLNEQKQAIIHRAVTRGLDPSVPLKPSGIPWLGDIPKHWEVRRLKYLANFQSGDGITAFQIEPQGEYPVYGGNGLRGYTNRYTHDGHFALIGRQGALCGNINYANGKFYASEHAVVATLRPAHSVIWFGELLRVMNLNQYSQSAAQPGLAVERIKNLAAPVPPAPEQKRIVFAFQDQTRSLTTALTRLEREIELLREYRTRLVADVVTGKLDVREVARQLPDEAGKLSDGVDQSDELDESDWSGETALE